MQPCSEIYPDGKFAIRAADHGARLGSAKPRIRVSTIILKGAAGCTCGVS